MQRAAGASPQDKAKPAGPDKPRLDEPADTSRRDGDYASDRMQSPQSGSAPQRGTPAGAQQRAGAKPQGGQQGAQPGAQKGGDQQRADAARDAAEQMEDAAQRLADAREQQISEWKEELTQ